jgi:hypothetical protein
MNSNPGATRPATALVPRAGWAEPVEAGAPAGSGAAEEPLSREYSAA